MTCGDHGNISNPVLMQTFRHVTRHDGQRHAFRPCSFDIVLLSVPMIQGIESEVTCCIYFFNPLLLIFHEPATWTAT